MYSLKYKVTTSTCDSEGRLKLYSALQMMQDCSEMWIDSEPSVKQYYPFSSSLRKFLDKPSDHRSSAKTHHQNTVWLGCNKKSFLT